MAKLQPYNLQFTKQLLTELPYRRFQGLILVLILGTPFQKEHNK